MKLQALYNLTSLLEYERISPRVFLKKEGEYGHIWQRTFDKVMEEYLAYCNLQEEQNEDESEDEEDDDAEELQDTRYQLISRVMALPEADEHPRYGLWQVLHLLQE